MSETALYFENFGAAYGEKQVLRGITAAIPPRSITAIIGPSGCGKSTLLKAANRMLDLDREARKEGSIRLFGEDIEKIPPEELRRRVGMVFQSPTPFPMSIYKNMTYAPLYYGLRGREKLEALTEKTLRETGLWEEVKGELHKSALKLSGGQQQRLCIARALTAEPEVLLLDEPCSALDVKSTRIIEELLLKLKERYTILIVTHNLFQARRIADECIFMLQGGIVEQGPCRELFAAPKRQETADYINGVYA